MKIQQIILAAVMSLAVSGTALAQTSIYNNTNTNVTTNNGTGPTFSGGFGGSFYMSNNGVTIDQNVTDNSLSQCFSFTSGLMQIVQIIMGDSFTQTIKFLTGTDPVVDPCLAP